MYFASKFGLRLRLAVGSLGVLAFLAGANHVLAVSFDFEAPTYTTGSVIGQNGWVTNNYIPGPFFGGPNGDFTISSALPLSGSQSLHFNQTAVTGNEGSPGASDISKSEVIAISPGTLGADLVVSYKYTASGNTIDPSSFGGLFVSPDAINGWGPVFLEFRGGTVVSGQNFSVISFDEIVYFPGDVFDVRYEVDFDTTQVTYKLTNLTSGEPEFSRSLGFMAGWGPEGPNGEFLVDVGILGRRGTVQYDDLVLEAAVGPVIEEFSWANNASGNWGASLNWTPSGIPGGNPGIQTAVFGDAITAPQTIYTNTVRRINALEFDSAQPYTLAGTGSIDLEANTSGTTPVAPRIDVLSGDHQLQLAVNLAADTAVDVAGGASLTFNNIIDLNGHTLSTSGNVIINHSIVGGGTLASSGALGAMGVAEIGGDLVSSGTLTINVGGGSVDQFYVSGDATLSGFLDVVVQPGFLPTMPLTVLSAGGALDASQLALHVSDVGMFSLSTSGSNLLLTYVAAVPEPASALLLLLGFTTLGYFRRGRNSLRAPLFTMIVVAYVGFCHSADAQTFNFENPPYTPGTIIGQQGWDTNDYIFTDGFFGGVVNGTVDISSNGAISGSQSILYTQTVDPLGAGGTGGSDIGQLYALFGVEDGTDAIDLSASVKLQSQAGTLDNGLTGFGLSPGGGRSPLFVNIRNVNATNGTGEIVVGDGTNVPIVGSYTSGDVINFRFGVDFDTETYEVFATNLTQGTPETQLMGSGPNGRIPFFFGTAGDDGDGVTHTMDVHVVLRSGMARVDDIVVNGDAFKQAVWRQNSSSAWQENESWIPRMIPGTAQPGAQSVVFGPAISSPQTVYTNSAVSVSGIEFDNVNKYAIAGGGSVNLKADTTIASPPNPAITVANGSHEFQVAVNIQDNTSVDVAAGVALDFNNVVTLGGKTLTTAGAVNLNVGVAGGGTIVNSGALGTAGTTPIAANLTSTGKLVVDMGSNNTDFFSITGNATLSGLIDVVLEPSYTPSGTYTILTASGTLNAAGLAIDPSDAGLFSLGVVGKSLVLTKLAGIPGDFDQDGDVDGRDFLVWQRNTSVGNLSDWKANYGQPGSLASVTVPEPAAWIIMLAVPSLCCCARSRRQS